MSVFATSSGGSSAIGQIASAVCAIAAGLAILVIAAAASGYAYILLLGREVSASPFDIALHGAGLWFVPAVDLVYGDGLESAGHLVFIMLWCSVVLLGLLAVLLVMRWIAVRVSVLFVAPVPPRIVGLAWCVMMIPLPFLAVRWMIEFEKSIR